MAVIVNVITRFDAAGMKAAEANMLRLNKKLAADQTSLAGGFMRTGQKLSAIGSSLVSVGKNLTTYVTLPIAAAAGAALYMGVKFKEAMLQLQTSAGASSKQVTFLTNAVLGMKDALYSPTALAGALYHIVSLGYQGTTAMKMLDESQKAAAMTGSDLEQTTSALGAVYKIGINGAKTFGQAMGGVIAIVGAGNMRLQDFVNTVKSGYLVAAKDLGMSLASIGAGEARLSDITGNAQKSAQLLNTTLMKIVSPSAAATKIADTLGFSYNTMAVDLRKPDGLVVALEYLREKMKNLTAIQRTSDIVEMFGGLRGGQGMMALMNNIGALQQKYVQITKTTKAFAGNVNAYMASPAAQFKIMIGSLEQLGTKVGLDILPPFMQVGKSRRPPRRGLRRHEPEDAPHARVGGGDRGRDRACGARPWQDLPGRQLHLDRHRHRHGEDGRGAGQSRDHGGRCGSQERRRPRCDLDQRHQRHARTTGDDHGRGPRRAAPRWPTP